MEALRSYVLKHNDVPTPSDLIKIINPEPAPLSKTAFIALCQSKERGEYLTQTERKFMCDYETQEMKKSGYENSGDYRNIKKNVITL